MNSKQKLVVLLLALFFIPAALFSQPSSTENRATIGQKDTLTTIEGKVICINEELAKLRGIAPECEKYGYLYGLQTPDGTIWSFFLNPIGKKLREDREYYHKQIRIRGKLFYNGKIIEVHEVQVIHP